MNGLINAIFTNKVVNINALKKFGFLQNNQVYSYEYKILNKRFILKINVNNLGNVTCAIKDCKYKVLITDIFSIAEPYLYRNIINECEYYLKLICEFCFDDVDKKEFANGLGEVCKNEVSSKAKKKASLNAFKDYLTLCRLAKKNCSKSCRQIKTK